METGTDLHHSTFFAPRINYNQNLTLSKSLSVCTFYLAKMKICNRKGEKTNFRKTVVE